MSEPERVTVPVLIVANTGDTCPASPPKDAPKISAALTQPSVSQSSERYLVGATAGGTVLQWLHLFPLRFH